MKARPLSVRSPESLPAITPAVLAITLVWMGLIVIWEWSGADLWVVAQLADSHGFA